MEFKSQVLDSKLVNRERKVWEISAYLTCGKASWRIGEEKWGERGECGERDEPSEPVARCEGAGGGQASPEGLWPPERAQAAGGRACPGNCP